MLGRLITRNKRSEPPRGRDPLWFWSLGIPALPGQPLPKVWNVTAMVKLLVSHWYPPCRLKCIPLPDAAIAVWSEPSSKCHRPTLFASGVWGSAGVNAAVYRWTLEMHPRRCPLRRSSGSRCSCRQQARSPSWHGMSCRVGSTAPAVFRSRGKHTRDLLPASTPVRCGARQNGVCGRLRVRAAVMA